MLPLSSTELINDHNNHQHGDSFEQANWPASRYSSFAPTNQPQQLTFSSAKQSVISYQRYGASGSQASGNHHRTPSYIIKRPSRFGHRAIRSLNRGPQTGNLESDEPGYRRISTIFSYIGGFVFALIITRSYLHFETTTNVFIRNPEISELPATSFCFFYDLRNHLYFAPKFVRGKDLNGWYNLTNKDLGEINAELPQFGEFVKKCEVLVDNDRYQTCLSVNRQPVIKYLSLYSKCYTMFEFIDIPRFYEKREIGSNWLLSVTLNVSRISTRKVGIFLTHRTEILGDSLFDPTLLQLNTKDFNSATVTYKRTVINKLPPPFDSNCFDYESLPCKKRATCIRRCIVEQSFIGTKAWIDRRYVRLDEYYLKGRFGIEDENNYTEYCFRKYPEEPCKDYLYQAILHSQFHSPFGSNETFQINMGYPLTETIVEFVQLQSFMDYICFVSSTFSLWTDATMIKISESIFRISLELLSKLLRKCYSFI